MKKGLRTFLSLMTAAVLAISPVQEAFASNNYDATVDMVTDTALFPGDHVSGLGYIVDGDGNDITGDGSYSNTSQGSVYKLSDYTNEDGSLTGYQVQLTGWLIKVTGGTISDAGAHYTPNDPMEIEAAAQDPSQPTTDLSYAWDTETVKLSADMPTDGRVFNHWELVSGNGTIADPNASSTDYIVGTELNEIKAVFAEAPQETQPETQPETDPVMDPGAQDGGDVYADPGMQDGGDVYVDPGVQDGGDVYVDPTVQDGGDVYVDPGMQGGGDVYVDPGVQDGGTISIDPSVPEDTYTDPGQNTGDSSITDPWQDPGTDGGTITIETSDSITWEPEGGQDSDPITIDTEAVVDPMTFIVKVVDGTVNGETEDGFEAGELVTVTADPLEGYTFVGWESDNEGVFFEDSTAEETVFPMPAADVTVTAKFEEIVEETPEQTETQAPAETQPETQVPTESEDSGESDIQVIPVEPQTEVPLVTEAPQVTEAPEVTEVQTEAKTEVQTEVQTEEKTEAQTEAKTEESETEKPRRRWNILHVFDDDDDEETTVTEPQTEAKTEAQTEPQTEAQTEPQTEAKTEAQTEPQTEAMTEAQTEPQTEAKTEAQTEPQTEAKTEAQTEPQTEAKTEAQTEPQTEAMTENESELDNTNDDIFDGRRENEQTSEADTEKQTEATEKEKDTEKQTEKDKEKETEDTRTKYRIQLDDKKILMQGQGKDKDGYYAYEGDIILLSAPDYTSKGYIFTDWSIINKKTGNSCVYIADSKDESLAAFEMPAANVYIQANYAKKPSDPKKYSVWVANGSGDGQYEPGQVVTIVADPAPSNMRFVYWNVTTNNVKLANRQASTTTFVMPAESVRIDAIYTWNQYKLTVQNGSGSGTYSPGTTVQIAANWPSDGYEFAGWQVLSSVGTLSTYSRFYSSLVMPAGDVTVKATYKAGPNPANNYIDGIKNGDEYLINEKISFAAYGAGMSNSYPNPGDYRYEPVSYQIGSVSGSFKTPYHVSMAISAAGNYTLTVTFAKEVYDGNTWKSNGTTDKKSVNFSVVSTRSVKTGDNNPLALLGGIAGGALLLIVALVVVLIKRNKH